MDKILYMNSGLYFLIMMFLHVCADFNMQGDMSKMKKKDSWNMQDPKFKFDYTVGLIGHAFQWSFVIHLPVLFFCIMTKRIIVFYIVSVCINTFIHALIDTERANDKKLNLIQDQWLHILQIIATWAIFCNLIGV